MFIIKIYEGSAGTCNQGAGGAINSQYCGANLNILTNAMVDIPICGNIDN